MPPSGLWGGLVFCGLCVGLWVWVYACSLTIASGLIVFGKGYVGGVCLAFCGMDGCVLVYFGFGFVLFLGVDEPESLILAQSERWRHA